MKTSVILSMLMVLEWKSSFKILKLSLTSKLDWSSCIVLFAKYASKKIGTFISMKFLTSEAACCLYKSTTHFYMEYCCHTWAGTPGCYLEMFNKLQKQVCMTVGLSLTASLELLVHCWNVASLSLFKATTLVDYHLNLLKRFHFVMLVRGALVILIGCMIFIAFLDFIKISGHQLLSLHS